MNAFHSISSWWKRFSRKRRLSMLNATDNVEEWYTHISPAGLLAAFLAFALLLFILILSIVAYTPVLELLPGYRVEAARSRRKSDAKRHPSGFHGADDERHDYL